MSSVYSLSALAAFIILLVCITGYDWKKLLAKPILPLLFVSVIIRFVILRYHRGFETDMNCFKSWAGILFENGLSEFYSTADTFTDYPPGYMYILYFVGMLRSALRLDWYSYTFDLLIKLPAIICDVLIGVIVYKLASRKTEAYVAALLASAYLFNPAVIIDSAAWGQVDSVYTLFILASICFVADYISSPKPDANIRLLYSFLLYAMAILVKPQAFIFAPIYLFCAYRVVVDTKFSKHNCTKVVLYSLSALAFIFLAMVPFTIGFDFMPILNQYIETIASYPHATVNAYNFYGFLGANWHPVTDKLFFFSYNTWGIIFIDAIVLYSLYLLNRNRSRANVFFTAGLINALVFMFSVRMHERYLYPSLAMFLIAYLYTGDKRKLLVFAGYSLTFFINCADILAVFAAGGDYDIIKTSMPFISMLNMIITGLLLYVAITVPEHKPESDEQLKKKPNNIIVLPLVQKIYGVESTRRLPKMTLRDLFLIAGLMLIYSSIAFVNLGNLKSPQTVWTAQENMEVIITLPESRHIDRLQFLLGAKHDKSFLVFTSEDGTVYHEMATATGKSVFAWHTADVGVAAQYIKLRALDNDLMINEMSFHSYDGSLITIASVSNGSEMLFDEQELVPEEIGFMNGTYFDEIYHARTAYEFINRLPVYEWTHPPLGKFLISIGVSIFGMTPFGWRFVGTLFGVLMIPLMYCFGKKMLGSWRWAFFTALIFTFDFMHFAQTRIATIDTYVTFFIIGMYYFMFIYYNMNFHKDKLVKTLIPLGLSGLFMGLAIACKWPGIYASAGLAALFFYSFYLRTLEYINDRGKSENGVAEKYPRYAAITIGCCVIFFIAVPIVVYMLSYIPYLRSQGGGIASIIKNQADMYGYHAHLESEHPYSSSWWSWPFNWRPMFYYVGYIKTGVRSGISSMGNPAVWWCGIAAFFYCVSVHSYKKDRTCLFLIVAFAAQYLPWLLVGRTTYIYHYFPSLPFIVLMIAFFFKNYVSTRSKRITFAYAAIVLVLFVMFYPVLSGMPVSIWYVQNLLQWLPTWQLI